jgi:hypothetical protein
MSEVDPLSAEQRVLRAWAQAKLGHVPRLRDGLVASVKIETGYDDGWSEYTPGEGAYTDITAYGHDGSMVGSWHYNDDSDLIIEVCRFAGDLMQQPADSVSEASD